MSVPNPDDSLLLIRCPSCGQRFRVGEDLRERTVECGGCEHRFRINDESIVRGRKFYPGERRDPTMNRYQRVPLPGGEKLLGVQPIRYSNQPDPAVLDPVSPQRILGGFAGVIGMTFIGLLLMFGASRGGLLDGMEIQQRLIMAGFAGALGTVLLMYANPRGRFKSVAVGAVMTAGLMTIPFFFKTGSQLPPPRPPTVEKKHASGFEELTQEPAEEESIIALRNKIGTDPLVAEISRQAKENTGKKAYGLWLRGMSESNRFLVMDYILRVTAADRTSHFYPRGSGDFLMVVTGVTCSLNELAGYSAALGNVENSYPQIAVVEVRIRNENFVEGAMEKLSNRNDAAFYELNKRELESIDLQRVKRAVQRLADAEPKVYRTDISRKFVSLIGESGIDFKGDLAKALKVWASEPGPAGRAALDEAKRLFASNKPVPKDLVELAVKEKTPDVVPVIDELWFKNPMEWETLYGDVGRAAELSLIRRFPQTQGTVRYSAIRLLGRVGGPDSLPLLETTPEVNDPELKVLLDNARKSIQGRKE